MVLVHTEIEIDRSPEEVRRVFFDFPKYSEWHSGFSIEASTLQVAKGDKLNVNASGMKFTPIVQENSTEEFRWLGSLPYIFTGEHKFRFEPSKITPGGTKLIQSEDFTGLLSFLVGPTWSFGKSTTQQFSSFNESLKRRVNPEITKDDLWTRAHWPAMLLKKASANCKEISTLDEVRSRNLRYKLHPDPRSDKAFHESHENLEARIHAEAKGESEVSYNHEDTLGVEHKS